MRPRAAMLGIFALAVLLVLVAFGPAYVWGDPGQPSVEVETHLGQAGTTIYYEAWPAESQLTVTVDDPDTPESPDADMAHTVRDDGWGGFAVSYPFDVEPGWVITVSDGTTTKSVTVVRLIVTTWTRRPTRCRASPNRWPLCGHTATAIR